MESGPLGVQVALTTKSSSYRRLAGAGDTARAAKRRSPTSRPASTTRPAPSKTRRSPFYSALRDEGRLPSNTFLMAWTTTPWTLPSNLGVAVGADIDLRPLPRERPHTMSSPRPARKPTRKQLENAERIGTLKGSELAGLSYEPLFDYFSDTPNAFRILVGGFVTVEDARDRHMAPDSARTTRSLRCQRHSHYRAGGRPGPFRQPSCPITRAGTSSIRIATSSAVSRGG